MCEALIVVQTEHDGGAMHAARRAFEQRRQVFTLDMDASGNQALAEQGATAVPDADALVAAVNTLEAGVIEQETDAAPLDLSPSLQLPLL